MQTACAWFLKNRYLVLCLALFAVMSLFTANGNWAGDFWEHSAAVRELATNLFHPKHHLHLLDAPSAFYSPYSLMVAILSRVLHLDPASPLSVPIASLSLMGLVNLGLFLAGLYLFVGSTVPDHQGAKSFYTLLFTLFLWGVEVWRWSGFFHVGVLGRVLPYPSTFAIALSFIAIGLNRLRTSPRRQLLLIVIFLIAAVVLLSHPPTFPFLAAGLVAMSLTEKGPLWSRLSVGGVLCLAVVVALFWPYYSLLQLVTSESHMYHSVNASMYAIVVQRTWPALLLGVPLAIARVRSKRHRTLLVMLSFLLATYALGALSGKYELGRVLPQIVLLLHLTTADFLTEIESKLEAHRPSRWSERLAIPVVVVALASIPLFGQLRLTLYRSLPGQPSTYDSYLFLSRTTGQYDVILSDLRSSWPVPTFGGKIVASLHTLAFVPDHDARVADVERFFDERTSQEERQEIIDKYSVDYVLLNKSTMAHWRELLQMFDSGGRVQYENEEFVLVLLESQSVEKP